METPESVDSTDAIDLPDPSQSLTTDFTLRPSQSALPAPSGVTVSTVFNPTLLMDGVAPDLIIVTCDTVHFHVHSRHILHVSANAFCGMLVVAANTITVTETAPVMNVVLHALYGRSCTEFEPTFEDVAAAVAALVKYGASLSTLAVSPWPLFALLIHHAPPRPIDVYTLAGQYELEQVAVAVSAHLLSYDTSGLTDEMAVKMGTVYLARLIQLHQYRLLALKAIVLTPPGKHPATATCSDASQARVLTAWAVVAAQLVWDVSPGISAHALQAAFERAYTSITCTDCRDRLHVRIHDMAQEWSAVKNTI